MMITVYFEDTGMTRDCEFEKEPRYGEEVTFVEDGKTTKYLVTHRSGIQSGNKPLQAITIHVEKINYRED